MMWKEKYKIGIPVIDEQHQELFSRVADFVQAIRQEGRWEEKTDKVKETMAFLQDYVVTHFNYEEGYQQQLNYPEREQHHQIHEDFKADIRRAAAEFTDGGYHEEAVQKLAGRLLAWLINHVVATDLKMAQYVTEQGLEEI